MHLEEEERRLQALADALDFIKRSQTAEGYWKDFRTPAGEAIDWVTGYVGHALANAYHVSDPNMLEMARLSILKDQQKRGGWGYYTLVPPDADSTSFCLLFLLESGPPEEKKLQEALSFLLCHQTADGGFCTYRSPVEVRKYMGIDENIPFHGWCSSQNCVSGVATQVLLDSMPANSESTLKALSFIRQAQKNEGYWESYWWDGRLYATYNCIKALSTSRAKADEQRVKRAQDWVIGIQRDNGGWREGIATESTPFSTALAVKSLLLLPKSTALKNVKMGVSWLVNHQVPDGGWMSHPILRIPPPFIIDPWNYPSWNINSHRIGSIIRDHNRLFSTATAFSAISAYCRYFHEQGEK